MCAFVSNELLYIGIISYSLSFYGFLVTTVLYELPLLFVCVPKYTEDEIYFNFNYPS